MFTVLLKSQQEETCILSRKSSRKRSFKGFLTECATSTCLRGKAACWQGLLQKPTRLRPGQQSWGATAPIHAVTRWDCTSFCRQSKINTHIKKNYIVWVPRQGLGSARLPPQPASSNTAVSLAVTSKGQSPTRSFSSTTSSALASAARLLSRPPISAWQRSRHKWMKSDVIHTPPNYLVKHPRLSLWSPTAHLGFLLLVYRWQENRGKLRRKAVIWSHTTSSAPGSKISSAWALCPFMSLCGTLFSVDSCFVQVLLLLFLI